MKHQEQLKRRIHCRNGESRAIQKKYPGITLADPGDIAVDIDDDGALAVIPIRTEEYDMTLIDESARCKIERLSRALREKEILYRELAHRTKNSFAVMQNLLGLELERMEDYEGKRVIEKILVKLESVIILHMLLGETQGDTDIDLRSYLGQLLETIQRTYQTEDAARLSWNFNAASVDSGKALVVGLIVNELVLNAFKHAHPENSAGKIAVEMSSKDENVTIRVSDDGPGFGAGRNPGCSEHQGLEIVSVLARRIGGQLSVVSGNGLTVCVDIPASRRN